MKTVKIPAGWWKMDHNDSPSFHKQDQFVQNGNKIWSPTRCNGETTLSFNFLENHTYIRRVDENADEPTHWMPLPV